jgi:membrane glycosyltransferase
MLDTTDPVVALHACCEDEPLLGRRLLVLALNTASFLVLGLAMARLTGSNGLPWTKVVILILFMAGLPWTLLAFWNSLIGFVILRFVADPAVYTNQALRRAPRDGPISTCTAVCLAIRNEDVARVFARLTTMIESLEATPWRSHFAFHLLSDSNRPEVVAAEESAFADLKARHPRPALLHYRRRLANVGFKAGNLREFAERTAGTYDHMIVLDADSLMSAAAILRLVRVMQANPRLGILQTLVVGLPAESAFTRIFQFGMRQGMRMHTIGIAWWQGPSGPYWGHNAIIRLAPFLTYCWLPILPGRPPLGGHLLSHDQVEAALMRAAGYEVRVIADEFESWEESPPSLPDFIKRDLRWCQGNMQYFRLVARSGLRAMGRFHLVNGILMYLGAPFWVLMLASGLSISLLGSGTGSASDPTADFPSALAFALYFGMLGIALAPRLLGVRDALLRPAARATYGGMWRLMASAVIDVAFSVLIGPILMVAQSLFIVGLCFGRRVVWEAQDRDRHRVSSREALRGLWPQLSFGALFANGLTVFAPGALPWAAPTLAACALAIPFACATTTEGTGRWMSSLGLCSIPDEYAPATELRRLQHLSLKRPRQAA